MRQKVFCLSWLFAGMVLVGVVPARADLIDASQLVGTLGVGYRPEHPFALGQTFTAPEGATRLATFDIWMGLNTSSGFAETLLPFDVRAFVQKWTESDPNFGASVGNVIAASSPVRVDQPSTLELSTLPRLSFTLNAPVTGGDQYVLFVSAFGFTNPQSRAGFGLGRSGLSFEGFNTPIGTDYLGGHLVTGEIVGTDPTQSNWCRGPGCNFQYLDLAFVARFDNGTPTPTPEPPAVLLVGLGIMAALWRGRRLREAVQRATVKNR